MAIVTPSEFSDWRNNPVTKAFFDACHNRVVDAMENLSVSAGLDNTQDNMLRGFILAYREIPAFRIEDLEEVGA